MGTTVWDPPHTHTAPCSQGARLQGPMDTGFFQARLAPPNEPTATTWHNGKENGPCISAQENSEEYASIGRYTLHPHEVTWSNDLPIATFLFL